MLGMTWAATMDGALDEIGRLHRERGAALDALTDACRRNPDLERDPDICRARMALLR